MAFEVIFTQGPITKTYAETVRFAIEGNGVLAITDGDDVIYYAPHAWTEVRSTKPRGRNEDPFPTDSGSRQRRTRRLDPRAHRLRRRDR